MLIINDSGIVSDSRQADRYEHLLVPGAPELSRKLWRGSEGEGCLPGRL